MDSKSTHTKAKAKAHIVCVPFPAQGHIIPMMQLAKLLNSKDFYITFISTEHNQRRLIFALGDHFLNLSQNFRFETIPDGLPRIEPDQSHTPVGLFGSIPNTCLDPFKNVLTKLKEAPEVPPVTAIIADAVMSFAIDAGVEFGIPVVTLWTASACGLMAYFQFPEFVKRRIFPFKDQSFLTDGTLDTKIDWIPGMTDIRLKDIPSFIQKTDANDVSFNFMKDAVQNSLNASAMIINTFDALEHEVLQAISSNFPRIYTLGPLNILSKGIPESPLDSFRPSLWKEDMKCLEWLDKREPNSVVYVNYGSVTKMTNEHLKEFAWGLENSKLLYRVFHPNNRLDTESLKDIYNDLKCKNCFEVVMVVDDDTSFDGELGQLCPNPLLQGKFDKILSKTPSWAAIPFSDITSRRRLKSKFGHFGRLSSGYQMVLIDSRGMVVDTSPQKLFHTYGSEAYPFSDTRLAFLKSKDKTAFSQRSLKEFLGSSERDFVITNKGEEVPLHTLEDKVVALYFYEDGVLPDFLTRKLMMYYEELKKNQNFEVVLLYLYDTRKTIHSTEEKFQKTFGTMPWLALPYKDLVHKKLKRLFGYPDDRLDNYGDSHRLKLVIVGPRINIIGCRDVIEPGATTILRGYDGNLFMHEEFDKVEGERVSELKLEMLCSPNTIFKRRDGSQIQFSQLLGKRIIFLFEGDYPDYDGSSFRESLKSTYMRHKGTADEFEVIYFTNNKEENSRRIADMPWFISCAVELLPGCSAILSFYGNCYHRYHSSLVLAFGRDGTVVRRSICPRLGNDSFPYYDRFPFYADGVDTEAFDIERSDFCWGYWDTLYQGLLRDSRDQIKFPSANHLFCVYYY